MIDLMHINKSDRAISNPDEDLLDRGAFVDSLIRALVVQNKQKGTEIAGCSATGYVVGLTGQWGLGKSSVLNLLEIKLDEMNHVVVATFNPWLFSGRDDLVTGFFNALRTALGKSNIENAREIVASVDRYWNSVAITGHAIATAIDFHGAGGLANLHWSIWGPKLKSIFPKPRPRTPDEERKSLEEKISKLNFAIVVLIDELDRIEDDEVRAVAQLIKAIGDIKGISYLVAYDSERTIEALGGTKNNRGARYLEKIIQHPIPLPPLHDSDKRALIEAALNQYEFDEFITDSNKRSIVLNHLIDVISTPREVTRLIGTFTVLERAVHGEVCPLDILLFSWLITKSSTVHKVLSDHIHLIVDDPNHNVLIQKYGFLKEKDQESKIKEIIGVNNSELLSTLLLLFPTLERQRSGTNHSTQLSKRGNLVRMLHLGNPPSFVKRSEIQELWESSNQTKQMDSLNTLLRNRTLDSYLDRLRDFLPNLSKNGDELFWSALAQTLKKTEYLSEYAYDQRRLCDDAETTLSHIDKAEAVNSNRLGPIIERLIVIDDFNIVPAILRTQIWHHKLSPSITSEPYGNPSLSLEMTTKLMGSEIERYRNGIFNGNILKYATKGDAIYNLLTLNLWDENLRDSLTTQLTNENTILSISSILTPQGQTIDKNTADELFDSEYLLKKIEELDLLRKIHHIDHFGGSLKRLHNILIGKYAHAE